MLEDTLKALPAIDQIANGNHLLMMKAVIPYLPHPAQQIMALYAKASELTNILGYYQSSPDMSACSTNTGHVPLSDMLQDIRCFCSQEELGALDQLSGLMQMMELFGVMQNADENPDMLKNLLTPEQQAMFETCQSMFTNDIPNA